MKLDDIIIKIHNNFQHLPQKLSSVCDGEDSTMRMIVWGGRLREPRKKHDIAEQLSFYTGPKKTHLPNHHDERTFFARMKVTPIIRCLSNAQGTAEEGSERVIAHRLHLERNKTKDR